MQRISGLWKTGKNGKIIIITVSSILFLCLCCFFIFIFSPKTKAPALPQDENSLRTAAVQTVMAGLPSNTPLPTATPLPSKTPLPTETEEPTVTPTALPEPIVLTGSGDNVIDTNKWDGPAILKVTYTGPANFAIKNYSPSGDMMDLLVNTIGNYSGTLPLDLLDAEMTSRFEITASGPWELQIIPFIEGRKERIPATVQGQGDEVIILPDMNPDLLKITADQASRNFAIWGYSENGRDLMVNEIAPYSGTVMAKPNTFVLVISATGPWSIDITTK